MTGGVCMVGGEYVARGVHGKGACVAAGCVCMAGGHVW